mmetsp:Transcript_6428/g.16470  ORF Transcript_6428/g.16470 Transcript_6428/m.16470 type:complete len:237 (-) Transcript_6428:288-998(-)
MQSGGQPPEHPQAATTTLPDSAQPMPPAAPVNAQPATALPSATAVPAEPVPAYQGQPYIPPPGYEPGIATIAVIEQREVTAEDALLLSVVQHARITKLLSLIDLVFTVISSIMQVQLLMLVLIFGPLAGLYAAMKLNSTAAAAYAIFSVAKAVLDIVDIVLILSQPEMYEFPAFLIFILVLSAAVQLWIAKVVFRFRQLLLMLTPERLDAVQRLMTSPPPLSMRPLAFGAARRERV